MEDTYTIDQETKFNAGIEIALDISKLVKQSEFYATAGIWTMWHLKLEAFERRMETKFREKKEARGEIDSIKRKGLPQWKKYLLRYDANKKTSKLLMDDVKTYLTNYERALIFWRDKFGYGMPAKDDITKAAWR